MDREGGERRMMAGEVESEEEVEELGLAVARKK